MLSHFIQEHKWKKSSYSVGDGACVEVANRGSFILIRDSKQQPAGPEVSIDRAAWCRFIKSLKM